MFDGAADMAKLGGGGEFVIPRFSAMERKSLSGDECGSMPTWSNFVRRDARAAASNISLESESLFNVEVWDIWTLLSSASVFFSGEDGFVCSCVLLSSFAPIVLDTSSFEFMASSNGEEVLRRSLRSLSSDSCLHFSFARAANSRSYTGKSKSMRPPRQASLFSTKHSLVAYLSSALRRVTPRTSPEYTCRRLDKKEFFQAVA
jgi:hypothetical protein